MKELGVAAGVIIVVGFFAWLGYMQGYTTGFCDALHGTALNGYTCNVDGKVVEVR